MRNNVENIVKELARESFNLYPDCYQDRQEAIELAENYWDNRTTEEIKRDDSSNVVLGDYVKWVLEEFNS